MFIHKINYTDFMGNEKSTTLYFHLSAAKLGEMIMEESVLQYDGDPEDVKNMENAEIVDGLSQRIRGVIARGKGSEILELFHWLMAKSYGVVEEDGERFRQGSDVYEAWKQTASFEAFYGRLQRDATFASEFFRKIMPKQEELEGEDPEFRSHNEALKARRVADNA